MSTGHKIGQLLEFHLTIFFQDMTVIWIIGVKKFPNYVNLDTFVFHVYNELLSCNHNS